MISATAVLHDPLWFFLNKKTGWRSSALENPGINPLCGCLQLNKLPAQRRTLLEDSGSLGGLTPPQNVALGRDGSIFLLDRPSCVLKRFDPCECEFKAVPYTGGTGRGSRQFSDPHGIGIYSGDLFVCDTGNNRVSVFSLRGFVLRDLLSPPVDEDSPSGQAWQPRAIAFDARGVAYIAADGCIYRHTSLGRWLKPYKGFGEITNLAVDRFNRLYIVEKGAKDVKMLAPDGLFLSSVSYPEEVTHNFPPIPFSVDEQGNLLLKDLCSPKADGADYEGFFDLEGNPAPKEPGKKVPTFEKAGCYISQSLDSMIYECQWHRIVLTGEVPQGSYLTVSTYTAGVDLPDKYIADLPPDAWDTREPVFAFDKGAWDGLVLSGAGRYLWLKVQLEGDGLVTPSLESVRIEFPRVSLRRYLPAVFGEDPHSADFTDRFLGIFDTTLRSVEEKIDNQALYFDPLSTPVEPDPESGIDFLSWFASWIGVSFDQQWTIPKRRRFLKMAAGFYKLRGTREGLWRQLLLLLNMGPGVNHCPYDRTKTACPRTPCNETAGGSPCAWEPPPIILEHFQLRRWLFVGAGGLGDQAVLWGKRIVNRSQLDSNAQADRSQLVTSQDPYRDPFHVFAHKFSIFVPASFGRVAARRKSLEKLINSEKPAHTICQIEYVEPRFRIGFQSMIGYDSVIGRYPEGVPLGETVLGSASVVGAADGHRGPLLAVGKEARVGTTTKLD
jgi:phage tail-like protein